MRPLHVHAVGTTGLHARERRAFVYADHCAQCGVAVDASTRVASHVLTYRCAPLNCCVASLSLQTCCRRCNARHQVGEAGACCARDAAFYASSSSSAPVLARVAPHCCWVTYRVPAPAPAPAPPAPARP